MAEAARMRVDVTIQALDELILHDLVEFDQHKSVARLTELPDAGEWPQSPFILKSWWKRFHDIPECQVRDAHVATLRIQLERGAREAEKNVGGKVSLAHEEIWSMTFGQVKIPSPRRRGVRRLADDDTSTPVQPSLFPKPPDTEESGTDVPLYPQGAVDKSSDPPSAPDQRNQVSESDSGVTRGVHGEGEGEGEGEGVFFSSPEGESVRVGRPKQPQPERAGLGTDQDQDRPRRPHLKLVPPALAPFTVAELLGVIDTRGLAVSESERAALGATIEAMRPPPEGEDVRVLLKQWVGRVPMAEVLFPGGLERALARARQRKCEAEEKSEMLRVLRESAGV
jgi:hypothetical protein